MATQIDNKYKSPYEDHEWEEGYDVWGGIVMESINQSCNLL